MGVFFYINKLSAFYIVYIKIPFQGIEITDLAHFPSAYIGEFKYKIVFEFQTLKAFHSQSSSLAHNTNLKCLRFFPINAFNYIIYTKIYVYMKN